MSHDTPIIVEDVRFTYAARRRTAARRALDGVTLHVPAGAMVALLGPNGSGKSTLFRIMCGMLVPGEGRVTVFGTEPAGSRHRVGVVFQSPSLDPHLTVRENLRDHARLFGLGRRAAEDRLTSELSRAGLDDRQDDVVHSLSGGLARRVDLCRALLHRPDLLLLDEPTTGLDPMARRSYLDQLARLRSDERMTVCLSTHLTDEADSADLVALLDHGRIAATDAPGPLRARLGHRRVTVLDPSWRPADPDRWERRAAGLSAPLGDDPTADRAILDHLVREDVAYVVAPPTLADAFETLTGATLDDVPASTPEPAS